MSLKLSLPLNFSEIFTQNFTRLYIEIGKVMSYCMQPLVEFL